MTLTLKEAPAYAELDQLTAAVVEQVLFEVKRLIVGQDHVLERLLVALLARGHVLLEGVPGLAKTATIKALAQVVGGSFGRVQFTPDLVPADLIGTRVYNGKTGEWSTELGPVFANLLLADEINRAPAKVQSALLEVMQERQVTIGKQTFAGLARFWCWQPKTRSSRMAPIRCPRRNSTAFCSK
jgi:MoxR-like ATPase